MKCFATAGFDAVDGTLTVALVATNKAGDRVALIICPDCSTEVSNLAAACPKCARPIASADSEQVLKLSCKSCFAQQKPGATTCENCGTALVPARPSNAVAGCLGLLLGPVGLWYKGQWAAGFAWLVMTILLSAATAGVAAPFCWIGMAIHAASAEPRT